MPDLSFFWMADLNGDRQQCIRPIVVEDRKAYPADGKRPYAVRSQFDQISQRDLYRAVDLGSSARPVLIAFQSISFF